MQILGFTLILHWIPNASLKKNPRSLENSPSPNIASHRRQAREEFSRTDQAFSPVDETLLKGKDDSFAVTAAETNGVLTNSTIPTHDNTPVACNVQICTDNERRSITSIEMVGDQLTVTSEELDDNTFISPSSHIADVSPDSISSVISSTDSGLGCTCKTSAADKNDACNCDSSTLISEKASAILPDLDLSETVNDEGNSDGSSSTSGPDSQPPSVSSSPARDNSINQMPESPCSVTSQSSGGSMQMSHNLTFPENSVSFGHHLTQPISARDQLCGVFSVDLGEWLMD